MHILYVEDDKDIRAITEMVLAGDGFTLVSCESGLDAIKAAKDITPDLLLLDVMMPGMNGPETLLKLQELPHLKDIPFIFMTAKVQPKEVEQYKAMGALGVINKPYDPMTLVQQIQQLIDN